VIFEEISPLLGISSAPTMGAEASVANRATLKNLPSLVFMIRRELVLLLKTVQQSLYSHRNTPPYFAKWNLSKFHKIPLFLL
jgi:hypothetical protein